MFETGLAVSDAGWSRVLDAGQNGFARNEHTMLGHAPEDPDWHLYRAQVLHYLNALTDRHVPC